MVWGSKVRLAHIKLTSYFMMRVDLVTKKFYVHVQKFHLFCYVIGQCPMYCSRWEVVKHLKLLILLENLTNFFDCLNVANYKSGI